MCYASLRTRVQIPRTHARLNVVSLSVISVLLNPDGRRRQERPSQPSRSKWSMMKEAQCQTRWMAGTDTPEIKQAGWWCWCVNGNRGMISEVVPWPTYIQKLTLAKKLASDDDDDDENNNDDCNVFLFFETRSCYIDCTAFEAQAGL